MFGEAGETMVRQGCLAGRGEAGVIGRQGCLGGRGRQAPDGPWEQRRFGAPEDPRRGAFFFTQQQ